MKSLVRLAFFGALTVSASAQAPIEVEIFGAAANHQLSWTTTIDYNYQVYFITDLETWMDTGIAEPGTGGTVTYGFMCQAGQSCTPQPRLFYRIHETADPYNGGFLVLPIQDQEVDLIDGVCFAFDLNLFSALPAKIRIYQRVYDSGDPWEQVGQITDVDEIDGIKFVRGSAVWLPESDGEYEVQATVVDGAGTVISSAVRRVIVGSNQAPTITITNGPTTPSAVAEFAAFTTSVYDPDGDSIRRVEFYDNGVLIGTDREALFGDEIEDLEQNTYYLLRGTHNITAKAYDSRGAVGETVSAFQVVISNGNSRPTIEVISPSNSVIVTQGQDLTLTYEVEDLDGAANIAEVHAYNIVNYDEDIDTVPPFGALTINTAGWTPGSHTIRVVARDFAGEFDRDESYPLYITVFVRTGSGATFAETLVEKIVDGVTAAHSNEVFTGVEASSGIFSAGLVSGLEVDSGALLTTGSFAIWNGGDNSSNEHQMDEDHDPNFGINYQEPGDLELEDRVSGDVTRDAAVLEFDVFCSNGQLEMVYQFGSEEYEDYVGVNNDAFMATVDGVLVTFVPDCSDIVAINTVYPFINAEFPGLNEHLFLDDDLDISPRVAEADQAFQAEYNGMTIRLKAHVFLKPNTTHRVKIVIADVDDQRYDSGLFIDESSIRTITPKP